MEYRWMKLVKMIIEKILKIKKKKIYNFRTINRENNNKIIINKLNRLIKNR